MSEPTRPRLAELKHSFAKEVVLDAAEQLLRESASADFSMRTLCERAGVSFTTPFNYFGSKSGILRALALRLFERIADRYSERHPAGDAVDRVIAMADIGVGILLENSAVRRAINTGLVASDRPEDPRDFFAPTCKLWSTALGNFDGFERALIPVASASLAQQLAASFRGTTTLWLTYEIPSERFGSTVRTGVAFLLLGLVQRKRRETLLKLLQAATAENGTIEGIHVNTKGAKSR